MRVCGAKPPVADILDKITGAPGGALHHDVGHCFIVCHNVYLIFVAHFFTPVMLLVFMAIKPAQIAIQRMSKPRPSEPPAGYPIWPRWFSTVCFVHNRVFSNYFVLA